MRFSYFDCTLESINFILHIFEAIFMLESDYSLYTDVLTIFPPVSWWDKRERERASWVKEERGREACDTNEIGLYSPSNKMLMLSNEVCN